MSFVRSEKSTANHPLARPMTEQETKVATILRNQLARPCYSEDPEPDYNAIAVEIVRDLATDMAFKVLTGATMTLGIDPGPGFGGRCACTDPIIKCNDKGCICQMCGLPG